MSFGGRVEVLRDISLDVAEGTFLSVLGASGCGKSTLLRLLAGLLTPGAGTIEVFGASPSPGPDTGVVFQSFRLLPWRTARRNVAFPLEVAGLPAAERDARVDNALELVGLAGAAERFPAHLSGGMQQRVALARALSSEPRLLLMDEE